MDAMQKTLEAALFSSAHPLSIANLRQALAISLGMELQQISPAAIRQQLEKLSQTYANSAIELKEVASGYRFQVRSEYAEAVEALKVEKPPRYSRALLETLALIAYRQPITRSEIEAVRGVAVSSQLFKTLLEREWIKVVGQREIPGRPALYATTAQFLDYFNLKSLEELPTLAAVQATFAAAEAAETSEPDSAIPRLSFDEALAQELAQLETQ